VPSPSPFPVATLRALLDRIIPADEFPGAIAAGVDSYVMQQLMGRPGEASHLIPGLAQLDVEASSAHGDGVTFAALDQEKQEALLRKIEAGQSLTKWPLEASAAHFFARMVELAHEGYYADPGNGGNRDAVSWKMIGYDPRVPPVGKA
jgi:hypothetical protein